MRCGGVLIMVWLGFCAPAYAAAADAMLAEVSFALAAGQYQDAVTVAGSALNEPGLSDLIRSRLLIVRGLARQAQGANNDALVDFTQGLSIAALPPQERARALFARGVTLDSLDRLENAVDDYSAVLRLAPGATYALNNRANVRRRQGRLDEAKRDYLAALTAINPNLQYPFFGLGQIAEAQGDAVAARGYYNKALAAAPSFPLALERLQAIGAQVEGPAGLPGDTGVIVLKPPAGKSAPAVALKPLEAKPSAAPAARARPTLPSDSGFRTAPVARTSRGASLRPMIVEGQAQGRVEEGSVAQLGAWRSYDEARAGWAVAQDGAGGLLDSLQPVIMRAEIPGRGVFWRLRTATRQPVAQFCGALAQRGLACIPVRN